MHTVNEVSVVSDEVLGIAVRAASRLSVEAKLKKLLVRSARPTLSALLALSLLLLGIPGPITLPESVHASINNIQQADYRWYDNLDDITPTTALSAENSALTGVSSGAVVHLRMNLANGSGQITAGSAAFKLQYGTSTSGPWSDVGGIGSGSVWRGYDNATPADGATLPSAVLSSSDSAERQSYEEANPSVSNPESTEGHRWTA